MEFYEFVNRLYPVISGGKNKALFVQDLFLNVINEASEDNIVEKTQLSTYRSYASGERTINRIARKIREYLEPACFEKYIDDLSDEQRENICSEFSYVIKEIDEYNVAEKLSRFFVDIIIEASKQTGRKAKNINNDIDEESDSLSEELKDKARRFIIDHESEKNLFALCQVAFNLNPMHNHVRDMYTAYNKCDYDVRNAIMRMSEIPILDFENEWTSKYIELFCRDIKRLKLCGDSNLLYDSGKYFHNAMKYPKETIPDSCKYSFPTYILNHNTDREGALYIFLDEYINGSYNLTLGYEGQPPLEWMITNFNMLNADVCSEKQLAIWLNIFVHDACYVISSNYNRKKPEDVIFLSPSIDDIEIMEDLYYSALLNLHSIYS